MPNAKFACKVCGATYDDLQKAVKCEEQGIRSFRKKELYAPDLEVGQVVIKHDEWIGKVSRKFIHGHDQKYDIKQLVHVYENSTEMNDDGGWYRIVNEKDIERLRSVLKIMEEQVKLT